MAIRKIFGIVEDVKKDIENLSVDGLKAELGAPGLLLADIREIQERVDLGTIPGSKHVPRGMLEFWADPAEPLPLYPGLVRGGQADRPLLCRWRPFGVGRQGAHGHGL